MCRNEKKKQLTSNRKQKKVGRKIRVINECQTFAKHAFTERQLNIN